MKDLIEFFLFLGAAAGITWCIFADPFKERFDYEDEPESTEDDGKSEMRRLHALFAADQQAAKR